MTAAVGERTRRRGSLRVEVPYRPTLAEVERATRVAEDLAARREVVVVRAGWGGGWYVTGVDAQAFVYSLWRDGAAVDVPWADVTE